MKSTIVIFTGLPGTGKTSLSRQISKSLRVPLIAKDDIKEIMYDKIGWSDKEFSGKLARATLEIMNYVTTQHLESGDSIILESNYSPKLASEKFKEWQTNYGCKIIQIVCQTEVEVLAKRYFDRQNTNRHPGHLDSGTIDDYIADFNRRIENEEDQPLYIDSEIKIVNTTDFNKVDVDEITKWISNQK